MKDNKIKKILLVEDEAIICMSEKLELEKYGYNVIACSTGEKAIEICNNFEIDLVLMDINLANGIDGTEAAGEILKNKDIPIVFLSSHTEPGIVKKTEKITSYGYVVKNTGITVLDASIKMAFKLYDANKKTEEHRQYLRATLESIGDAMIATDESGRITLMNYVAEKLTGWQRDEAQGKSLDKVFNIVNSKTRKKVVNPVKQVLKNGMVIGLANDTILISRNKTEYQIADTAAPICDRDNNLIGVILVFRDITEEYEMQNKIRESEYKLQMAIEASEAGYYEHSVDFNKQILNERWAQIAGYKLKELPFSDISSWWQAQLHPDDRERVLKVLSDFINNYTDDYKVEFRMKHKSGSWIWISTFARALTRDNDGKVLSLAGLQFDITKQKTYEETLKESEARLRIIFDYAPIAIALVRVDGTPILINKVFSLMMGYSQEELQKLNFKEFTFSEDLDREVILLQQLIDGKIDYYKLKKRNIHKNGRLIWLDVYIVAVRNDNGEIDYLLAMGEEISKQKDN